MRVNQQPEKRRLPQSAFSLSLAPAFSPLPICVTLLRMTWHSHLLLALAALIHLGLLAGWRWQRPLVPHFFDTTVLSGGRGLDFYAIYQAGYNARHGADVYESERILV